jgi:ribosomal protein S18 acetylase RimI-like enzyme
VRGTERALREAGARRLCVQTVAFNEAGIRFYERLGYRELARFPHYFHDADERRWDMVWLDRSLDGV